MQKDFLLVNSSLLVQIYFPVHNAYIYKDKGYSLLDSYI